MKSLANKARKEMMTTGKIQYDANAKASYQKEVNSLTKKLNDSLINAPKEREANRRANAEVSAKEKAYEEKYGIKMESGEVKKLKQQALTKARTDVGSVSRRARNIDITDREWEAIQAGAISENTLKKILNNTDVDKLKERAMPRTNSSSLSKAQVNRIKSLAASNYSLKEIAKKMGISTSAVSNYLKGGDN
jgi:predicted transcriptional regulator